MSGCGRGLGRCGVGRRGALGGGGGGVSGGGGAAGGFSSPS